MDTTTAHADLAAAAMCNMTLRAVPKRGSVVVPERIFQTVVNGKPDRLARSTTWECDSRLSAARTWAGVGMLVAGMPPNVPLPVCQRQPPSVHLPRQHAGVSSINPADVLWPNICSLLGYGPNDRPPSIDTVQRSVGVGRGTVQRIKERSAATQLDSLTTIATKLKVPVWKLLQPAEEAPPPPAAPHGLSERALEIGRLFDQIEPELRVHVEALVQALQPVGAPAVIAEPSTAPSAAPPLHQ